MTSRQENKFSMYTAVQLVCNDNPTVWNGLPAFVTAFNSFETNIVAIDNVAQFQRSATTGVATDKEFDEDEMVALALEVADATFAYASDTNNNTLKDKMAVSRTSLKRARDTNTLQDCQDIHDESLAVVGSLASYGVNNAKLIDLQNLILAAKASQPTPQTAKSARKVATSNLAELFDDTDVILKEKMDKLMTQFKESDPQFYELYFAARIIEDIGTRTTFVSGTVLDADSAEPIIEALVRLVLDPGLPEEEIREVQTGELGDYRFESMKAGEAKLQVLKSGYQDVNLTIVIVRGRDNVFDVAMQRI